MRIGLVLAIVLACHGVASAGPSTGTRGVEVTGGFGLMIGGQDVGPHDGFTAPALQLDVGVMLPGGVRVAGELSTGLWSRERQGSDVDNLPPSSGSFRRFGATLRVPLMRLGIDTEHGQGQRRGTMWAYAEVGLGRQLIDAPDGHPTPRGGPGDSPLLDAFSIARSDLLIGFGMAPTVGLGKKRTLFGAFYGVRAILSGGAEPASSAAARSICKGLCPTEPSRQVDVGLYLTFGLFFGR